MFDDEVLAKVIAVSREDSILDAQLSIANAFTLPVFCGFQKVLIGWPPLAGALLHRLPLPWVFGAGARIPVGRNAKLLQAPVGLVGRSPVVTGPLRQLSGKVLTSRLWPFAQR